MKEVTTLRQGVLSLEQRNLLSVAYKNVIGARRASWRVLSSLQSNPLYANDPSRLLLIENKRKNIEKEVKLISRDVDNLLSTEKNISAISRQTDEDRAFYAKMKGDYLRYLAEILQGEAKMSTINEAYAAYQEGLKWTQKLPSTHPIRLGLALNWSVFCYEVCFILFFLYLVFFIFFAFVSNLSVYLLRFSMILNWLRRVQRMLSTMPYLSLIPWMKTHTRIPPSSCNSSVTTSPCGTAIWKKVKVKVKVKEAEM